MPRGRRGGRRGGRRRGRAFKGRRRRGFRRSSYYPFNYGYPLWRRPYYLLPYYYGFEDYYGPYGDPLMFKESAPYDSRPEEEIEEDEERRLKRKKEELKRLEKAIKKQEKELRRKRKKMNSLGLFAPVNQGQRLTANIVSCERNKDIKRKLALIMPMVAGGIYGGRSSFQKGVLFAFVGASLGGLLSAYLAITGKSCLPEMRIA